VDCLGDEVAVLAHHALVAAIPGELDEGDGDGLHGLVLIGYQLLASSGQLSNGEDYKTCEEFSYRYSCLSSGQLSNGEDYKTGFAHFARKCVTL
jgi:hypothetical protein